MNCNWTQHQVQLQLMRNDAAHYYVPNNKTVHNSKNTQNSISVKLRGLNHQSITRQSVDEWVERYKCIHSWRNSAQKVHRPPPPKSLQKNIMSIGEKREVKHWNTIVKRVIYMYAWILLFLCVLFIKSSPNSQTQRGNLHIQANKSIGRTKFIKTKLKINTLL